MENKACQFDRFCSNNLTTIKIMRSKSVGDIIVKNEKSFYFSN